MTASKVSELLHNMAVSLEPWSFDENADLDHLAWEESTTLFVQQSRVLVGASGRGHLQQLGASMRRSSLITAATPRASRLSAVHLECSSWQVRSMQFVRNKTLETLFNERLLICNMRALQHTTFSPRWRQKRDGETQAAFAARFAYQEWVVNQLLEHALKRVELNTFEAPKVLLCAHCTRRSSALAICENGFANLAKLDEGYVGAGIYLTPDFDYAVSEYARYYIPEGKNNSDFTSDPVTVLLCWVVFSNALPVHDLELEGKPIQPGYDAHVAIVDQGNQCHPVADNKRCDLASAAGRSLFFEVVVNDMAQILPVAIVDLQPIYN
jgi:hypothetical protein